VTFERMGRFFSFGTNYGQHLSQENKISHDDVMSAPAVLCG
jgi:hypothetical protein